MLNYLSHLFRRSIQALFLSCLFFFGLASTGYAQTSKTYSVEGFTGVSASAGISVEVKIGSKYSVQATFPDGYEDRVKVSKRFNTLNLGRSTNDGWADGKGKISIQVILPEISTLEAESGAQISGELPNQDNVSVKAFSGGRIIAMGSCERLKMQAASGGRIDLSKFECSKVSTSAYSGGAAKVYASDAIRSRTDSGGSVVVFGSPPSRDVKKSDGAYSGRTSFKD